MFDSAGELCKIEFPWQKVGNKQNPSWDNTVLGNIAIDGGKLTVEVNSENRAASPRMKETEDLNAHPEVQAQLQQMLRDYYRDWPHQAVPALHGLTPLAAMQTQDGPEMVEALLLQIERYGKQQQQPLDPAILAELRATLGLA